MTGGIEGKVALVTGGGRGLGAAVCLALAEAGMRVVVADVREDLAAAAAGALVSAGYEAMPLALDVAHEAQAPAAVREVEAAHGRLDVLVNNAGIDRTLPIEELTVADWDRVVAVNLRGPFLLAKHALPGMKARGEGHVVNVVSTAAKRAWANAAAYHASKWGLLGLSHALHVEARPHGVKVTAVVAGGMRTPFLLDRFPGIDAGTLQEPRHVAEAIRFVVAQPPGIVIPEVMVLPMRETSWP